MKKEYISPEMLSMTLCLGSIMQASTPTVESDTDNDIKLGGDAEPKKQAVQR